MSIEPGMMAATYKKMTDEMHEGKTDNLTSYLTEDCVIYEVPSLPLGGKMVGNDSLLRLGANIASQFESCNIEILHQVEFDGNNLVIIGRNYGVTKKVQAPFDEYYVEWLKFTDDLQIYQIRVFFADVVRMLRALGYTTFPNQIAEQAFPNNM